MTTDKFQRALSIIDEAHNRTKNDRSNESRFVVLCSLLDLLHQDPIGKMPWEKELVYVHGGRVALFSLGLGLPEFVVACFVTSEPDRKLERTAVSWSTTYESLNPTMIYALFVPGSDDVVVLDEFVFLPWWLELFLAIKHPGKQGETQPLKTQPQKNIPRRAAKILAKFVNVP